MAKQLIDAQEAARITESLSSRHGAHLKSERFVVTGRLDGEVVTVVLTMSNSDRSAVYTMETAAQLDDRKNLDHEAALELCLDFLDWYLAEYFKDGRELLLPLDFKPHRFGDHEVQARGQINNEPLEALRDAWLRGERPAVPPELEKP